MPLETLPKGFFHSYPKKKKKKKWSKMALKTGSGGFYFQNFLTLASEKDDRKSL